MIFDLILNGYETTVIWLINLIPDLEFTMPDISGLATGVKLLFMVLSKPVAVALLGSTVFWLTAQPIASLIKFIYRKIPGVS